MENLLQNPIFVREASILVHTLLLTGVLVSWLCKVLKRDAVDHPKSANVRYYRLVILSSLAIFAYNLVICCLNYLILSSDERLITLLDLALRSVAWLLITVYLKWKFDPSTSLKFPVFLRIWWGFYLAVSCYGLVTDLVIECGNYQCLSHFQVLGSDMVYVISGILFCCVGNFVKRIEEVHDHDLQEPLLIEDSNNVEISPYVNAGFFSNVTFSWVGSLISKGKAKALSLEDVPPLSGEDNVGESYLMFRNGFNHEGSRKCRKVTSMQIVKSLIFMTWGSIVSTFLYSLMYSLALYVGPYLIDSFVEYLNGMKVSKNEGYVLASAFVVAKLVEGISEMQMEFVQQRIGLRTKAVLMESVYTKALALSCQSKDGQTSGQMINYMSVDAERVGDFSGYLHDPWMITLQIVLGLLILYRTLGLVAAIAALIATVLVMLINYPVSNLFDKYYDKLMESRDRRMKTTTEILKNMRILKLQAWDMKFLSKIIELRNVEYEWLKKSVLSMAMTTSIFWVAPVFVSVVTFGTCLIIGVPLKSGKILSAIATFRILQQAIHFLPGMVSMIIQTKVSVSRIASFLSLDELDPNLVEKLPTSGVNNEVAVEITGGNFSWDVSASSPTLKDINLKIESGMRIAICGTVGSGKSTLLSCILREVPKISGMLRLRGSMAYVPQTPWIQSGTISDNILFGKEMDVEKYNRILEACCLKKDLEILPFGDQTIIGERGINLSGGQKQRVQIARALYQDADIYLLDDPFSAVDAHTGTHLFKECVLGLLQCKTVMYVTHQMEFLPVADLILVMKEGCIQQAGKYDDILNSGTDFMELVAAHEEALSTLDPTESATDDKTISNEETTVEKAPQEEKNDTETDDEANRPKGQLVREEEREKGRVGRAVYWKYITTVYKGSLMPFILLSQVLFQTLQILSNYWIAWATPVSQDSDAPVDGTTLIVVYVSLAIVSSLFILVRALLLATAGYKTASVLFDRMHFSIFRAPMSFFDANPNSRVLNRVSTDQAAVDMNTPTRVGGFAFSVISLLGVIVVMSLVVWQVYLIFVPIIAISLWYQQYYLPAARELFRLNGVSKAPVIQHFTESIAGAAIIRSYGQETRFCETIERLINGYLKPKFYSSATTHWLSFRLDMLSSLIFSCTLIFLIFIPVGSINPVVAGLAVTYALNLNSLQSRVITNFALMENRIISVERILQYTGISSEAPLVVETNRPNPSWPSHGQVDFQDVQVRYAPQLPLVLQGITCTFQGGKKTGIVGRTGCGKSTLIQALFRIVEPAAGRILIDGANISSIGLHDLRSRLSIIPQDPTMFQGTIRGNLDPLEEYTDEQIWEALDKCQLGDEVRNKEGKLDSTVSENGENWSVGQRQLVCLGRVLLKRSKVLVLDEATASVDTATDNVIQQTLRQHFSDSTVITVAHRITSVINSDQVVVLSHGVVEECDTPSRLLANQSSSFSKLVAEYTTRSKSKM